MQWGSIRARWSNTNRKYYEKRGYVFTNYEDEFLVKHTDFTKNSKMNILIKCDYCRDDIEIGFRSYYRNVSQGKLTICNNCKMKMRLDNLYERIVKICSEKSYVLITTRNEIIDEYSEIVYICPIHGETKTRIRSILEGKGCYWCGRDNASIKMVATTLENRRDKLYKDALQAAKNKGYILLSNIDDIINNTTYIKYLCPKHGVYEMRIANFIWGKGCPDCVADNNSERFKLSPDEVEQRISACHGHLLNKYDYINQTEKNLWVECFECGNPFKTSLRNFTQHGGQVCKNCCNVESLGEKRIRIYLENNSILFEKQKWFPDCRDRNPLPFDFYLQEYNLLIEYDGRQHFEETDYFTYTLKTIQYHDQIKNNYCLINGIRLIRIPYWNYNKIEEILKQELILHKDIV